MNTEQREQRLQEADEVLTKAGALDEARAVRDLAARLRTVEQERDEATKERESLVGELARLLGPVDVQAGVTFNDQWIAKVAALLARVEALTGALLGRGSIPRPRRRTTMSGQARSAPESRVTLAYVEELEERLRMACEPCAECGHLDYRELDSIVDGEAVTRYSPFTLAAPLACGHPPQDIDPQTGLCESCDRWYAAGTCQATFEAVAEIEDADDGADGCPLCGLPSYQHRSEGPCSGEHPDAADALRHLGAGSIPAGSPATVPSQDSEQ